MPELSQQAIHEGAIEQLLLNAISAAINSLVHSYHSCNEGVNITNSLY